MAAVKPLTTEAFALTEKKMDMALDDIIKMAKVAPKGNKKQHRVSNKNQTFAKGIAQDKPAKLHRYMDSRSSTRQGVLAQRRSKFQGNHFPAANEAARKAAAVPLHNRAFNHNQMPNWKPRTGAPVQRRSGNVGFSMKQLPPQQQQRHQQQQNVVANQKPPQTLDLLFANLKEQRMRAQPPHQNYAPQQRHRGRPGLPWGRGRQFGNYVFPQTNRFDESRPAQFNSAFSFASLAQPSLVSKVFVSNSLCTNSNPLLFRLSHTSLNSTKLITTKVSSESGNEIAEDSDFFSRVSSAKDAQEALKIVCDEMNERQNGGVVSVLDCCSIITAALKRNNPQLALSVFYEMRASFDQGADENGPRWRWSRPDVSVYTRLVLGLAASLRVSDALKMISNICRVGVSPAEEVPFGKVVRYPSCMIAVAVAQPQHGIQIASCAKCSYQYELVSGNIDSITSEEIGMDIPAWKRALRFLQILKQKIPAAVHSIVLPQRVVDAVAIKQQLLSQYDTLQSRLKALKEAAEKEVWMCQLENKIYAVGEPSYRARRTKVKKVREGLENSLRGRIELIDSYARISSMIEIEVDLDSDVLAAEQASNVENIAEQIQQTMELENLEERWRIQVEANDEAERLLSSQPLPTEQV